MGEASRHIENNQEDPRGAQGQQQGQIAENDSEIAPSRDDWHSYSDDPPGAIDPNLRGSVSQEVASIDALLRRVGDAIERTESLYQLQNDLQIDLQQLRDDFHRDRQQSDILELFKKSLAEFDEKISTLDSALSKTMKLNDETNQNKIQKLEHELDGIKLRFGEYRSGQTVSEVETFIRNLFPVYDRWVDIIKRSSHVQRSAAETAVEQLQSLISAQGVETYETPGNDLNIKLHAVMELVPTDDPDKHRTIARRERKGFKTSGKTSERILRLEEVTVYEYRKPGGTSDDPE